MTETVIPRPLDYAALKTEIASPGYAGMTDDQTIAAVNAKTVAAPKRDILLNDLIGYIASNLKLPTLSAYSAGDITQVPVAAAKTLFLMPQFGITRIQTSIPSQYTMLEQLLGAISADPASGLNSTDATAIIGFATAPDISWTQATLGVPAIVQADLDNARLA